MNHEKHLSGRTFTATFSPTLSAERRTDLLRVGRQMGLQHVWWISSTQLRFGGHPSACALFNILIRAGFRLGETVPPIGWGDGVGEA